LKFSYKQYWAKKVRRTEKVKKSFSEELRSILQSFFQSSFEAPSKFLRSFSKEFDVFLTDCANLGSWPTRKKCFVHTRRCSLLLSAVLLWTNSMGEGLKRGTSDYDHVKNKLLVASGMSVANFLIVPFLISTSKWEIGPKASTSTPHSRLLSGR
jgi:hypothetical protein